MENLLLSLDDSLDTLLGSLPKMPLEYAGVINSLGKTLAEDICDEHSEIVLRCGTAIGAAEMGLLAALGVPGVQVARRPRVSVITAGDDVVDLLEPMESGKVRNSTRYWLAGEVLSSGCDLGRLLHCSGDKDSLRRALQMSGSSDIVIVAGAAPTADMFGGSVRMVGHGAAIVPEDRPVILLPREPAAIAVAFEIVVRPALKAMLGRYDVRHRVLTAVLTSHIAWNRIDAGFVHGIASMDGTGLMVRPLNDGAMPAERVVALADCLIVRDGGAESAFADEEVSVIPLRGFCGSPG